MNTQDIEKIGGPCRDRTYDQLIKSQHNDSESSCSIEWDNAATQRLETTPFRGVLHPILQRYMGGYSTPTTAQFMADFDRAIAALRLSVEGKP